MISIHPDPPHFEKYDFHSISVNFVTFRDFGFDLVTFQVHYAPVPECTHHSQSNKQIVNAMTTLFQHKPDTCSLRGTRSVQTMYLWGQLVV